MSDIDNVRVAVRVRPMVPSELERGCQSVVAKTPGQPQVCVNKADTFTFNYVFDSTDTQQQVYEQSVSEMLDRLFAGFNATILAYGQTGSGKTHTMGTHFDGELNEHVGVIPRAMHDIFARVDKTKDSCNFVVTCSFMELYQEQLYDLLSTKSREESIVDLREDRTGIIMPGLTELVVKSALETTNCLVKGSMGRAVGSTAMNQQSSRSHAIFTVTIQAIKKDEPDSITVSKFHLVDLAGSERSKKTQATGDRFKEGVKINQGLLALGNVISALGSGQGTGFVRYRDSKLTRLLQDSLGGNSVTLMIACVSPADYNVAETLSTLRYADRARKIKNKPIVNQDPHAAEINRLKGIIQSLKLELMACGGTVSKSLNGVLQDIAPASLNGQAPASELHSKAYKDLQDKYHVLQQQLQLTLHDVAENEMRAHIAEVAHDKLKTKTEELKVLVQHLCHDLTPEADASAIQTSIKRIQEMHKLVADLDEELESTHNEFATIGSRSCSVQSLGGDSNASEAQTPEIQILMQEQTETYTTKQMTFKEELRRLNRELLLKEELQQRVAGNLSKFCSLEDNQSEEKLKECEMKINELESEKSDLLEKLRHVRENASAKLAEERRKRLQALEQEISDMKRKFTQQSKLLKVREKETEKIKNLTKEIQEMKESKVKLIRAMRAESENFRQWKMIRERELLQLKSKDRKMQNEMARKEALHTKQRNVLKRKCEEAMAINKRLKDALERQKVAQSQRQKMQTGKEANAAASKIDQVIAWVERELEVIITIVDGEITLEQLSEDCAMITSRMADLEQQQQETPSEYHAITQELASLQEELEMRNAQIGDLQAKVNATDIPQIIQTLCDGIQSLGESRAALKHLFKAISDMKREHALRMMEHRAQCEEQRALREAAEERNAVAAKRMRLMEIEHEEAIAERENLYEDKIAVLLRELHNAPQLANSGILTPEQEERMRIQQEQLDKMDAIREELDSYKKLVNELQEAANQFPKRYKATETKPNARKSQELQEVVDSSDEVEEIYDDSNDPDWVKTPLFRRRTHSRRITVSQPKRPKSIDEAKIDETFVTAPTSTTVDGNEDSTILSITSTKRQLGPTYSSTYMPPPVANGSTSSNNQTATNENELKRKRKHCSCRGNCGSKRCGCYSSSNKCSLSCRCSDHCQNGKFDNVQRGKDDGEGDSSNALDDGTEPMDVGQENSSIDSSTNGKEEIGAFETNGTALSTPTKDDSVFRKPAPAPAAASEDSVLTPKMARLSTLQFNTPSMKKKFFQ